MLRHKIILLTLFLILTTGFRAHAASLEPDSATVARRSTGQIITSTAGAIAINAVLTEIAKNSVNEMRPNRDDNHSFPSRHTSWAFAASTVLSNELYRYSPWWSLGAHSISSAIGMQRIISKNHYASDVIAGAAMGIFSAELSNWISGRIFGRHCSLPLADNSFRPSLAMTSEAVYNLRSDMCTGFGMALRFQLPLAEKWGAVATLRGSAIPVKNNGTYACPLNLAGITAGAVAHFRTPLKPLAIQTSVQAGAIYLPAAKAWKHRRCGFEGDIDAALSWRLTDRFACRATVGYRLMTLPRAASAITVGVSSVAIF